MPHTHDPLYTHTPQACIKHTSKKGSRRQAKESMAMAAAAAEMPYRRVLNKAELRQWV